MNITYAKNGDYQIPELTMDAQPEGTVGKYGLLRETYLKEHRKGTYTSLILQGKLKEHLMEIEQTATVRMERMTSALKKSRGITEALKASDPMRWTQEMNCIQNMAEETVLSDLIYS